MPLPVVECEPESRRRSRPSPDDLVFAYLRRAFPRVRPDQTVSQALSALRRQTLAEPILYVYAVDEDGRLHGLVPMRRLLGALPTRTIASLMQPRVVTVPASATVGQARAQLLEHGVLALPVIGTLGRMYGVVDVTLFAGDLPDPERQRPGSDDLFQLIGLHLSTAASGWPGFRDRFPSLLWSVAGGLLAALIASWYQSLIETVIVLALFLPVVLSLSESVSLQSVTLTLQSLRGRRSDWRQLRGPLWREVPTATLLGAGCGALIGGIAWAWQGRPWLAAAITATVTCAVVVAALIGVVLPGLLRAFRRDPHVASGPLVLAVTDFVTLLLYFGIATALLG